MSTPEVTKTIAGKVYKLVPAPYLEMRKTEPWTSTCGGCAFRYSTAMCKEGSECLIPFPIVVWKEVQS